MPNQKQNNENETTTSGKKNKNRFAPTTKDFSEKVKSFIDREKHNFQGNLKTFAQLVTPTKPENHSSRVLIGRKAPNFKATAVFEKDFKEIELSQYEGKHVVLFFYPLDFTFVCPTELHAFQEKLNEFTKKGVEVLACSVDSQFSHLAWLKTPRKDGGIKGITYGLISDLGGKIAQDYGVLSDEGVAYRALFLLDQSGIVRHQLVNDLPLGRNVEEALRMVDALQYFEKNGEVCPANWEAGKKAIKPSHESVAEYLSESVL